MATKPEVISILLSACTKEPVRRSRDAIVTRHKLWRSPKMHEGARLPMVLQLFPVATEDWRPGKEEEK